MLTPRECAIKLARLFDESTAGDGSKGQDKGAFRIFREQLVDITGRPVWHQTIIEDVADWLVDFGLILINRDSYFVIVEHDYFESIRRLPASTLKSYQHPIVFGSPAQAKAEP